MLYNNSMIYTCTTNPSLDYYLSLTNELIMGDTNRSEIEMYDAGGKGVNVSIVLNNFHIPNVALGFLGGFTKDFYLEFLKDYPNIQPLFTTIKDNTRINIKLMDSKYETGLNTRGPHISDDEFEKFKKRVTNIYRDDIFVLSGNIQDEIDDKMISLIHELSLDGVKVVLDTDKNVIDDCLDVKPFMVKLNDHYFEDTSIENIIAISKQMIDKGVQNILYSSANKPSFLFTKDLTLKCVNMENSLVNTTGSADSMVAGFLYSVLRGADSKEAFKYAVAASLSTTHTNDLASKEKIEEEFVNVSIEEI